MRKPVFSRNAHSLAEWAIIFAIIPVVFVLGQSWLKHTIQCKAQDVANYTLWTNPAYGSGARPAQQFGKDINARDKSKSTYGEYLYSKEREGTVYTGLDLADDNLHTHSHSESRQASFAVEQGSESVLNTTNLNQDLGLGDFWRN